jgi:hypothetical protein
METKIKSITSIIDSNSKNECATIYGLSVDDEVYIWNTLNGVWVKYL